MPATRISREALFREIAVLYARRGTCMRAKVGAVAVRDGRVIATGYNGAPSGQPHCLEVGCLMEGDHCIRTTHAEANLISWAARVGTRLEGSIIYCTHGPCYNCVKLLLNAGVVEFVYAEPYPHKTHQDLMKVSGLRVRQYDEADV